MAKLLLVEDDRELGESIVDSLEMQGYLVEHVLSGEDALQLLQNYAYDLVILDWELPGISGIELLKTLRAKDAKTPIFFLTGRKDMDSLLSGLETGADDYINKPFLLQELLARVRSRLRRPGLTPSKTQVGYLTVDSDSRKVFVGSNSVRLTNREFSVLEFLMGRPNVVFSAREILDVVWAADKAEKEASEAAVRVCIKNLRRKITVENHPCLIKTEKGGGYKLDEQQE